MEIKRRWAFWRRAQYSALLSVFIMMGLYWGYANYIYTPPTCFDGMLNGDERGVDCGGACIRICAADVQSPVIKWARSFEVTEGQYNAVAYVENANQAAGTPEVDYTFSLYDDNGLITERSGTTFLPADSVYPIFEGRIDTGSRVPTQTFLELADVSLWLPSEPVREQFSVISRELLGVDNKPRLNAVISNNALTPIQDVEIVATIFDARGNALTSSQTIVDGFVARSQENIIFTWPEPIAKTIRSCEVPTDVVMAIDLSGSMNNDQAEPPEPISSVIAAADNFVDRLQNRDKVSLVTFATEAVVSMTLGDPDAASTLITELTIDPEEETGSTNTGDAFVRASEVFASPAHSADARKVMVILTDGLATAPDEDPEEHAVRKAAELRESGVEVYAIGLGENVNMDFVRTIASEGQSFQALTRDQIDEIYQQITGAICEDGAAVIDIVPKSKAKFPELR